MFAAGIHLQVAKLGSAQTGARQHAFHSLFYDKFGFLAQIIGRSCIALSTWITGVTRIHFVRHLFTRELHLVSVDDDDVVTAVNVRSEVGLVLTTQDFGHLRSESAHHRVRSIDQNPLFGDRCGVGGDCFVA